MEKSRRKFLLSVIGLMGTVSLPTVVRPDPSAPSWKIVCKNWMQTLLPADEHGPGGDCPEVWANLERMMKEQPDVGQWIVMVFNALGNTNPPKEDYEIEHLLRSESSHAKFLRFFQEFLLESYYSSAVGWKELGFSHPNQPYGYPIKN